MSASESAGDTTTLSRRLAAEGVGTALLLAAVVGSGIMGERLAAGNVALALLANALATGAALVALILAFGPISGAHFNPVVTLAAAARRSVPWRDVLPYLSAQVAGAFAGVVAAHLMFGEPLLAASTHARPGLAQAFSEAVASFGLVSVIFGCARRQPSAVPFAVAAYISAAYWFTRVHLVRESSSHARARRDRHVQRNPPGGRARLPGGPAARSRGRDRVVPLAGRCCDPSQGGPMKTVIFACVQNAGRSQMAAAFFEQMANPALARAVSAGTRPAARVHPEVVEVMREAGLDLSGARPTLLTPELATDAQWLITMGCGDECPVVAGVRREDGRSRIRPVRLRSACARSATRFATGCGSSWPARAGGSSGPCTAPTRAPHRARSGAERSGPARDARLEARRAVGRVDQRHVRDRVVEVGRRGRAVHDRAHEGLRAGRCRCPGPGTRSRRVPFGASMRRRWKSCGMKGFRMRMRPRVPSTRPETSTSRRDSIEQIARPVAPFGKARSISIARSTPGESSFARADTTRGSARPSVRTKWST